MDTQYATRNTIKLGDHYTKHLEAMTAENLANKGAIAAELAWRDLQIEQLQAALESSNQDYDYLCPKCGQQYNEVDSNADCPACGYDGA